MLFIFHIKWLPDGVVKALCWTFIHSLWQGLVAAIIAGAIISSTRKTKASLRYNLLVMLFAILLIVIGGTYFAQLSHFSATGENALTLNTNPGNVVAVPLTDSTFTAYQNEAFINTFNTYCNEHAGSIMLLWFVFFMVKCIKTLSGLYYINRLKKCQAYPPLAQWNRMTRQLSRALGIHQPVVLLESRLVDVPVTVGFLKATILIPLGLLTNLPPEQVEAVLLHELAHIRRKDYLVNLLQTFAETILFFNPAVLWMSSLIRQEREACCDDMVLAHMPHKKHYLDVLVGFQEHLLAHPAHAMALAGEKYYLLHRIRRMLTHENQKLNIMEKTVLVLGILAVTAFAFVRRQPPVITAPVVHRITPVAIRPVVHTLVSASGRQQKMEKHVQVLPEKDTVPVKEHAATHDKNFSTVSSHTYDDGKTKTYTIEVTDSEGKRYLLKKVNDVRTAFKVNGRNAPEEKYAGIIDRMEKIAAEQSTDVPEANAISKEQQKKQQLLLKEQEYLLAQQEKRFAEAERTQDQKKQQLLLKEQEYLLEQQEKRHAELEDIQYQQKQKMLEEREDILKLQEKKHTEAAGLYDQKKQELLYKSQGDLLKQQEKKYTDAEKLYDQKKQELLYKSQDNLLQRQEKKYTETERQYDQKRQEMLLKNQEALLKEQDQKIKLQEAQLRLQEARQKQETAAAKYRSAAKELQAITPALQQEMIKDGFIEPGGSYELTINGREMLINGKKQPASVHQKYIALINSKRKTPLGDKEDFKAHFYGEPR